METTVQAKGEPLTERKDMQARLDYARVLLGDMDILKTSVKDMSTRQSELKTALDMQEKNELHKCITICQDMIQNITGRIANIMMRGYDIPLQGDTNKYHQHMVQRVMPEPHFFIRGKDFLTG